MTSPRSIRDTASLPIPSCSATCSWVRFAVIRFLAIARPTTPASRLRSAFSMYPPCQPRWLVITSLTGRALSVDIHLIKLFSSNLLPSWRVWISSGRIGNHRGPGWCGKCESPLQNREHSRRSAVTAVYVFGDLSKQEYCRLHMLHNQLEQAEQWIYRRSRDMVTAYSLAVAQARHADDGMPDEDVNL